jgi:hypothetical protein
MRSGWMNLLSLDRFSGSIALAEGSLISVSYAFPALP